MANKEEISDGRYERKKVNSWEIIVLYSQGRHFICSTCVLLSLPHYHWFFELFGVNLYNEANLLALVICCSFVSFHPASSRCTNGELGGIQIGKPELLNTIFNRKQD